MARVSLLGLGACFFVHGGGGTWPDAGGFTAPGLVDFTQVIANCVLL